MRRKISSLLKLKKGSVLVFTLLLLSLLLVAALSLTAASLVGLRTASDSDASVQAFQAADSGVEQLFFEIKDASGSGTIAEILSGCSGGTVTRAISSNITYSATFYDSDGNQLSCADAMSDAVTMKSTGKYLATARAIEATIPTSGLSCEDLQRIGNDPDFPSTGDYVLTSDIDCIATNPNSPENNGSLWDYNDPSSYGYNDGTVANAYGFDPVTLRGSINGSGYTIKNLYINRPDRDYVGLLDVIGLFTKYIGGEITNIKFDGASITGQNHVGVIGGRDSEGGLVIKEISVTNSDVAGIDHVGGVIGRAAGGPSLLETLSFSGGSVTGTQYVGGIVGEMGGGGAELENSYVYDSEVQGDDYVGGIVGYLHGGSADLRDSYASANVIGNTNIGGAAGVVSGGGAGVDDSFWNSDVWSGSSSYGDGKTTSELQQQSTFSGWDFTNIWQIDDGTSFPCLQWQGGTSDCPVP